MKKYLLLIILIALVFVCKSDTIIKIEYGHYLNYDYVIRYPNIKNLDISNLYLYKTLKDDKLKKVAIDYNIVYYSDLIEIDYQIKKDKKLSHDVTYLKDNKILSLKDIIKNKEEFDKIVKNKIKKEYQKEVTNLDYTIIFKPDYLLVRASDNIKIPYEELIDIIYDDYLNKDNPNIKEYLDNKKKYQNKKLVAITFDDGPSNYTDYLLDELAKRDVKVTFFLVGYNIKKHSETIKKMASYGHDIGNHTYNHYNLIKLDSKKMTEEIDKVNDLIYKYSNYQVKLVRPPYGSLNSDLINNNDYSFILWNVDTLDWKYRDSDKVYHNIIKNVQAGDIILLHDLYKTSIDGALKAIDYLKQQDYEFVTVSDLALYSGQKLKINQKYYNFRK